MSTRVRRWNRGMSRCSPAIVLSDLGVGTILWASYLFRWRSLTVSSSNPEVPAREVDEAGRRSGSRAAPSFPTGAQSEDETDENRKEQITTTYSIRCLLLNALRTALQPE